MRGLSTSDKVIILVRPAGTSQDMNQRLVPYWWWSVILFNDNTNRLYILKAFYADWNSEWREARNNVVQHKSQAIRTWRQIAHISVIRII